MHDLRTNLVGLPTGELMQKEKKKGRKYLKSKRQGKDRPKGRNEMKGMQRGDEEKRRSKTGEEGRGERERRTNEGVRP